ncbi:MAG: DNA polymerase III subunit gamma/tau [Phycisphaeraceae bacterium]|nr:DNA polymerase III subunit gamma/tau [Phycisphaeraceae bacterium]
MAYTVLARRYRSVTFSQVVGQEPIARTLISAIASGRVAHAYLFTGTRGVGKTSMARILARALNAPATVADAPTPGTSDKWDYPPKDVQQRMADAIMRGEDLNVIEIDGASNNRVEEARQLIAGAGLSPTNQARYKIYIIDEVHMLSTAAFNALLKTMEEPPAHVKFILCTTEVHKVPATIQSRCQRFDFRSISTAAIADHLKEILAKEKVQAEEEVVWQVARLGNGSMRDALSLLDRLLAAGQSPLTGELLSQMLGLPPAQLITDLIDALAAGDVAVSLQKAGELLDRGISLDQLIESLVERLHQMTLLAVCGPDSELVELSTEARQQAADQAKKFDAAGLVYMIALCENLQRSAKSSSHPRALLDATLVRLALAEKMADVTALLAGEVSWDASGGGGAKKKVSEAAEARPVGGTGYGVQGTGTHTLRPASTVSRPAATPSTSSPVPRTPYPVPEPSHPVSPLPPDASPAAVWSRILEQSADKRAMASWIGLLNLASFDGAVARLAPKPGHREIQKFVGERQRQQLAEMFQAAVGRSVRVELAMPPAGEVEAPAGHTSSAASQADRRRALDWPLVKGVLEHFDATLVGVRPAGAGQDQPAEAMPAVEPLPLIDVGDVDVLPGELDDENG